MHFVKLSAARQRRRAAPTGLLIRVSSGIGSGPTELAAFDAALRSAGVGDLNLIRLSSVIPPGSTLTQVNGDDQLQGDHGDRLFCVYAEAYASTPGEQAWAGIGWSRRGDGSGEGLFVEHHGGSRAEVELDVRLTLDAMSAGRGGDFDRPQMTVAHATCGEQPVCAVVVATYRVVPWHR
jgi:arginine decarboxylase